MKNLKFLFLGIISILFINHSSLSQSFEGKITFDIDFSNVPQPEMKNFLPNEMVVSLKDKVSRMEQTIGDGGNKNVIVYDYDNKLGYVAMDMMGQKILINIDHESFEENLEKSKNAEVKYLDEYKDILGYKCQKATINMEGGSSMTVYCTEEIPAYLNQEMTNLKGMPLEYSMNQQGMTMKIMAKDIKKVNIDKSLFMKPSGYREMSMDEFKAMTGSNIQY